MRSSTRPERHVRARQTVAARKARRRSGCHRAPAPASVVRRAPRRTTRTGVAAAARSPRSRGAGRDAARQRRSSRHRAPAGSGSAARDGGRGTRPPSRAADRRARDRAERTVRAPGAAPDERVRVEHAHQRDVHEEALRRALRFGEFAVLQVGADDARVVSAVPVAGRRSRNELQPEPHGLRRRLAGQAADERDRFAPVPQQSLVDRPPPPLPGGDASSGSSTPRCTCQRMNDSAARRNGRCRGARPVGPWYVRSSSARRASGSSRTAATCASAQASAALITEY